MHPNPAMLYFFALNKSKIIQFYYRSPVIEIGIRGQNTHDSTLVKYLLMGNLLSCPFFSIYFTSDFPYL